MKRVYHLIISSLISGLTPMLALAMTCPSNFTIINPGQTPDQITQLCGKPDVTKAYSKENENVPQQWSYFIPQTVAAYNPMQQITGTLKVDITFDSSGKAINISVNGIGVGASTVCGSSIQLGQSRDDIKSACGTPGFINKQASPPGGGLGGGQPDSIKYTEYYYNNTNPPTKLTFVNGQLISPP